jgi:hypothetical protein
MDIVIPVRKGGLGNQMFQVTAALIVAKETGKQVVLPKEQAHIHNPFKLAYEDTVFRGIDQRFQCILDDTTIYALRQHHFSVYPGEPGFEPWDPKLVSTPGSLILHGYFQYYPPIEKHEALIRKFFRTNLNCERGDSTNVGIHVRRGDYLNFSEIHFVQDISYYKEAMDIMRQRIPGDLTFLIFSDDLAWCKKQTLFQQANCSICETTNEIECLKEMISCEGGFVCGNSTYSWWAAFLGSYRKRNPVIVPKKWFKDETPALFPPEWILL